MKNHPKENVLLIYYKRKDGRPLTGEEELAWAQYRVQYPLPDEAQFDENKLHEFARLQQRMLSWQQFKQKHIAPLTIAYPTEKQEATVRPLNPLHRRRYQAVAASLLILLLGAAAWLFWPGKKAADSTVTNVIESPAILPGSTKAILYLAGDQTIVLDTVVRGKLAQQGNVSVQAPQPGLLVYTHPGGKSAQAAAINRLQVPRGGEYQLILADGTKVWLNAASSFRYPVAFDNAERTVELEEGEAYFEVAKSSTSQPFVVVTKGKRIQVLGTHFNVNAYGVQPVAATLLEGSVNVTDGKQHRLLHPGQQAVMNEKGITVAPADNMQDVIAWKNKFFSFHDTRLSVIMGQLGRWYDVEVVYKDPLNDEQFVIDEFPRSSPLQDLLDDLEVSKLVHFKVEGRKIIISK